MAEKADLLYGVRAIADYLGIRWGQAMSLCEKGLIPTFRLEDRSGTKRTRQIICALKSEIDGLIADRAAKAKSDPTKPA